MLQRALVLALTLVPPGGQAAPSWARTDTRRFEIHYVRGLAQDPERVGRSAERAYDRVGGRLNFALGTRVPLVLFDRTGSLTREQVVEYATSDHVAPYHPHRSRIVVPLPEPDPELEAHLVHELTHLLVCEILLPQQSGDGGLPRWVHEGLAHYMVGAWSIDDTRLMRDLVSSGDVPSLSRLAGTGSFTNARLNDVLGHAAFDYIESRWGPASIRTFVNALIVPRVEKTYDAVLGLTPAEFDAAFREYAARRFGR